MHLASQDITMCREGITNALIRLCRCSGWPVPLLACKKSQVFLCDTNLFGFTMDHFPSKLFTSYKFSMLISHWVI